MTWTQKTADISTVERKESAGFHHSENAITDRPHNLKETTHPILLVDIDPKRCKP